MSVVFRITEDDLQLFHDSLARCERNAHFFDLFYHRFLKSSPEVRAYFAQTDASAQRRRLRYTLYMCLSAARNEVFARRYLSRLGEEHRRMGVKPEHYQIWLESLLPVVRYCDPKYTVRTEMAWRTVLHPGIEIMQTQVLSP